jgi:LysM repeat protein
MRGKKKVMKPGYWAFMLLLAGTTPARANRYVTYVVRPSDTVESIAAEYYGNRARAQFITEFNGLPRNAQLHQGQMVKIPTSYRYRLNPGDALPDLALRLVGDRRRGPLLLQLNGVRTGDRISPGTEIQVPFQFIHVMRPGESLTSVARAYYGDPGQAKLLAMYNFLRNASESPAVGEKLVIPITHVRVRSVRLIQPQKTSKKPPLPTLSLVPGPDPESQKAELELAETVGRRVENAERSYHEGNYTEVPAALVKLLTEVDPSETQLVEVYRLLAFAYVALGETELAVGAFREVLDRQPGFTLDPVQTSPKIRAALEKARSGS